MKEYISNSPAETERIAGEIIRSTGATGFLALYGEMGAGKTNFVRGIVQELCPERLSLVHSPTFAIVNEYAGIEHTVIHFDLYRLRDEDDLISTGFDDYCSRNGLVVTEWSELFEDMIPKDAFKVRIEIIDDNTRRITLC